VTGDFNRGLERARQTEKVWVAQLNATGNKDQTLLGQLLHLRFNMANLLRSLGDLEKARTIDEQVLAEQRQLLGEDHPLTLNTAGSLAADLRALGHYRKALEQDEVTYKAWREVFTDRHPRTLMSLNNLATSYRLTGDYKTALVLDEQAYRDREIVLGKANPYTLHSFGLVGQDLREGGDYGKSVDLLREAAARYDEKDKSGSRAAINAVVNLAISLRSDGHLDEASELFNQAYDRLSDKFPFAPDTLNCRLSRSITMLGLGSEYAGSELRAVYDEYRSRLGDKHPHTLVCLNNMAMGLLDDDPQQARNLAREVAADFADVVGEDHPYTLAAEANLGISLARCGSPQPGLAKLRSVAERSARVLDPEHPDTLCCEANIALAELQAGEGDEDALATVVNRLSVRVGPNHPAVLTVDRRRFVPRVIDPLPF
jgi:tetratricopeptide (TPR) repeat protein